MEHDVTIEELNDMMPADLVPWLRNDLDPDNADIVIDGFYRDVYREDWCDKMLSCLDDWPSIMVTGFRGWNERSDLEIYADLRDFGIIPTRAVEDPE